MCNKCKTGISTRALSKIDHPDLKPGMERVRAGSTQLFKMRDPEDRNFISEENADVVLDPPHKHFYAEEVDGVWYWVNGCSSCDSNQSYYIRCEEHDKCEDCKCSPESVEVKWGMANNGWLCQKCRDHRKDVARELAFKDYDESGYSEINYWQEDVIKCPYCDHETDPDDEDVNSFIENEVERTCCKCNYKYKLSASFSISYTTKRTDPKDEGDIYG